MQKRKQEVAKVVTVFENVLVTLSRFSAIFSKRYDFCEILFAFLTSTTYCNGVYSKMKEFARKGSKYFPFRTDPFSEGRLSMYI